jgi:hypothetical protein
LNAVTREALQKPNGPLTQRDMLDYPNNDCRSASRFFRFASFPDSDLGFRVVLVTDRDESPSAKPN